MKYQDLVNENGELKDSPLIKELTLPLQNLLNSGLNWSEQEKRAFQIAYLKMVNDLFSNNTQTENIFEKILEEWEKLNYPFFKVKMSGHY